MSLPDRLAGRSAGRAARERGAALLVALVLVFVSALLGISAMETSGIETRLVVNERMRQSTFVAADAVIERAWPAVDAGTLLDDGTLQTLVAESVDERVEVGADVRLESIEIPLGYSAGTFSARHYRVSATAGVSGAGDTRTLLLGALRVVPVSDATQR